MSAETVIFTNSLGKSVNLTNRKPYILESVDGKGGVSANLQMQNAPYQDGATYIDSVLDVRTIPLTVNILASSKQELTIHRQELASVFNPKLGKGLLRYSNYDLVREIEVVPEAVPHFPVSDKVGRYQKATIDLIAPNPYWKDANPSSFKLEDYTGNFRFPFHAPGIRFAVRGDRRILINNGDSPAPIFARFVGNAVNPTLKNETTGEFIKINWTIPDDFEMHINTADGNKYVELVDNTGTRTNVFHYIDLNSTFFKLAQGENIISFITEGGNPDVYVEFTNNYLGV